MIDINGTLVNGHRVTAITKVNCKNCDGYYMKSICFVCDSVPMQIRVKCKTGAAGRFIYTQDTIVADKFEITDDITESAYHAFEDKCRLLYELKQF